MGFVRSCVDRIHESRGKDLKFTEVAKGRMSTGYLDPEDGEIRALLFTFPSLI